TIIVIFLSVASTAAYHLWAMQKAMFGPILKKYMNVHDPHNYELFSMAMIIVLALIFGIQPGLMTDIMGTAAIQIMEPVKTLTEMGVI
ncbi:MAG: dehydrogenase subunit, partial [Euryarchaeota archaeon]|nr:dehydrogenase subunit [Euryarchaeota archaeon]